MKLIKAATIYLVCHSLVFAKIIITDDLEPAYYRTKARAKELNETYEAPLVYTKCDVKDGYVRFWALKHRVPIRPDSYPDPYAISCKVVDGRPEITRADPDKPSWIERTVFHPVTTFFVGFFTGLWTGLKAAGK